MLFIHLFICFSHSQFFFHIGIFSKYLFYISTQTLDIFEEEISKKENLENKLVATEREHNSNCEEMKSLRKKTSELQVKVDFKLSLEKTFESLQRKYQQKVDELERVTKDGDNITIA